MELEPINRLTRDERMAAKTLGENEARYLVDTYYTLQKYRISAANQERAANKGDEPHSTISWAFDQFDTMEGQIKGALQKYAEADPVGVWAMSNKGVGPVITAGFLSRLELRPTVGAWWRFCGLDPSVTWGKGQKRPWNAQLKRLCWLLGESFTKVSGYEDAFYGKVYRERKELEVARNLNGDFAEQAAKQLASKKYGRETSARTALEAGRLPDAQIHLRSQRVAVKLFLSHLHHVWHVSETGELPPKPYILTPEGGHAHYIAPPNFPDKSTA